MLDVSSLFQYLVNQIVKTKNTAHFVLISLFEPKIGHLQLFPTLEGRNMSLKKLSMILCLFMNTSRIVCTFQYQKGHKMYTASN